MLSNDIMFGLFAEWIFIRSVKKAKYVSTQAPSFFLFFFSFPEVYTQLGKNFHPKKTVHVFFLLQAEVG